MHWRGLCLLPVLAIEGPTNNNLFVNFQRLLKANKNIIHALVLHKYIIGDQLWQIKIVLNPRASTYLYQFTCFQYSYLNGGLKSIYQSPPFKDSVKDRQCNYEHQYMLLGAKARAGLYWHVEASKGHETYNRIFKHIYMAYWFACIHGGIRLNLTF